MVIENVELMHECYPRHVRMRIAKRKFYEIKRKERIWQEVKWTQNFRSRRSNLCSSGLAYLPSFRYTNHTRDTNQTQYDLWKPANQKRCYL